MDRTEHIAALNDQLRRGHSYGKVVITRGIQALGHQAVLEILAAVAAFSDFTPDNDPYAEHDCAVMADGNDHPLYGRKFVPEDRVNTACPCVTSNGK